LTYGDTSSHGLKITAARIVSGKIVLSLLSAAYVTIVSIYEIESDNTIGDLVA